MLTAAIPNPPGFPSALMMTSSDDSSPQGGAGGSLDLLLGKTALVVEDEYLIGLDMVQTMRNWGLTVTGPVQTLAEAERLARGRDWDCVILDVNLDGTNTLGLARELLKVPVPVIFATAYASNDKRFKDDLSTVPRLGKPISYRILQRLVIEALK
jgi:DNA-binding response OmpR family regulator